MYNEKEFYDKNPSEMTELEAKVACGYWKGKTQGEGGHIYLSERIISLENRIIILENNKK